MNNKIIDCDKITKNILNNLKKNRMAKQYTIACLYTTNDQPSISYLQQIKKQAQELSIKIKEYTLEANIETILNEIYNLNKEKVDGIVFIYPNNKNLSHKKIDHAILKEKNIDPLSKPNTVSATLEILRFLKIEDLKKKTIVILGRGKLVGFPLFLYLKEHGYQVIQCHSKTKNIKDITSKADILISAIGKPHIIKKEYIKKDAIIIDIGTSFIENKIYGDVDLIDVLNKVKQITPTPNGIGPLTTAMLFKNVIEKKQTK